MFSTDFAASELSCSIPTCCSCAIRKPVVAWIGGAFGQVFHGGGGNSLADKFRGMGFDFGKVDVGRFSAGFFGFVNHFDESVFLPVFRTVRSHDAALFRNWEIEQAIWAVLLNDCEGLLNIDDLQELYVGNGWRSYSELKNKAVPGSFRGRYAVPKPELPSACSLRDDRTPSRGRGLRRPHWGNAMIWWLVGYMWLFVHRPFEVWPWLGALHVERVYMIATILYWATGTAKTWTSNRINWGIGFLAVAIVLATCFSPYAQLDDVTVQNWFKILVFYVLVMSSIREERELRILVIAFVAIAGLYEMHSFREYLCGRGKYAMDTWRMVGVDSSLGDPNSFAASVNYGLVMLLPLAALASKPWHYLALGGLFLLACVCVFLTGSRTGFAGLALLFLGGGLMTKYRWRLVLLLLMAAPLAWASLPQDLQNRYLTLLDPTRRSCQRTSLRRVARTILPDSGGHLEGASPSSASGQGAFPSKAEHEWMRTRYTVRFISELGTVGAIALIVIIGCYLANYLEAHRLYRSIPTPHDATFCYRLSLATAIALAQLLFFGLGGHNLYRFTWMWYGAFAALALKFLREHSYAAALETAEIVESPHLDAFQPFGAHQ